MPIINVVVTNKNRTVPDSDRQKYTWSSLFYTVLSFSAVIKLA